MTTPFNETDFIQIKNLSDDEIYKKEETGTMVSFSGYCEQINKSDIVHLIKGGYLLDLTDGEYVQAIKLAPDAIQWLKSIC
ncbi:hypothetical protein [Limosilactobacillus reuteri]|uniref:hypothetical protein n=1 Tax=Limosilactobacillus reuteri TaxID=1598 RepID=UPI00143D8E67|nr:hypothetical protein [Limosilactobacillus reuteri]QIZ04150.1 hypothetical protein GXL24_03870 [Limosilactobacillus reuteri]